jgi:hypothetical protein
LKASILAKRFTPGGASLLILLPIVSSMLRNLAMRAPFRFASLAHNASASNAVRPDNGFGLNRV